jgi:septal ring factor EnvC (AmiA/AmiB activator)
MEDSIFASAVVAATPRVEVTEIEQLRIDAEDKITELRQKIDDLQTQLSMAKQSAEASDRSATRYAERLDAVTAFMEPLVAYIGEHLLENSSFISYLHDAIADKIQNGFESRDFERAVEDAISNLTFEVSIR